MAISVRHFGYIGLIFWTFGLGLLSILDGLVWNFEHFGILRHIGQFWQFEHFCLGSLLIVDEIFGIFDISDIFFFGNVLLSLGILVGNYESFWYFSYFRIDNFG